MAFPYDISCTHCKPGRASGGASGSPVGSANPVPAGREAAEETWGLGWTGWQNDSRVRRRRKVQGALWDSRWLHAPPAQGDGLRPKEMRHQRPERKEASEHQDAFPFPRAHSAGSWWRKGHRREQGGSAGCLWP